MESTIHREDNKKKTLFGNAVILYAGKFCTQFLNFFLLPLYTATLSTEEYGMADIITTYTMLSLPLVLWQMENASFRFLVTARKEQEQKSEIISTVFWFMARRAAVVFVVSLIFRCFVQNDYVLFFSLNLIAIMCSQLMLQLARGLGDTKVYAAGTVLALAVQAVVSVFFLIVFEYGIYGMLSAMIAGNVACAAFIFIKSRIYACVSFRGNRRERKQEMLRYAIPLIPNQLSWWLINSIDRIIIVGFCGMSAVGILAVSHKLSGFYVNLYNTFHISWEELVAFHWNEGDDADFFYDMINDLFLLFICLGVCLIAVMPFVFPILIHGSYSMSYHLIPLFFMAAMFQIIQGLYGVFYIAMKRTRDVAKTSLLSGGINAVADILLVKYMGIYAAPVSSIAALAAMTVHRYMGLKKHIRVNIKIKNILAAISLYLAAVFGYYCGNVRLQAGILVMILCACVYLNKKYVLSGIQYLVRRVK